MIADLKFSCPDCQQHLSAPADMQGATIECPACRHKIQIPQMAMVAAPTIQETDPATPSTTTTPLCAYCQSPLGPEETMTACPECQACYHAECWEENKGCAVYGCSQVPETEHRDTLEIPVSYWGQEHKNCPVCQTSILAAAVRCRSCGTTFASARPEDSEEFRQRALRKVLAPGLQKKIIWMFVLCVVPCLSPFATLAGGIWYARRRPEIHALPSLYSALCLIGIAVGIGQTAIVIVALLAAVARGR